MLRLSAPRLRLSPKLTLLASEGQGFLGTQGVYSRPGSILQVRTMGHTRRQLLIAAVAACAVPLSGAAQPQKPQITIYEAPGNLQSKAPLGCVSLAEVTNQHTPADIYPGVAACIRAGSYEKAVPLYAVAGTFGRFDQLRVTDVTARGAIQVLQMNNFLQLPVSQREAFTKAADTMLGKGSDALASICAAIERLGPPAYFPTYMVQHGMKAIAGASDNGIKADLDANRAWGDSLAGYLQCP